MNIVRKICALGCCVDLLRGDVTIIQDVQRCFGEVRVPIGGIIQGAMVLRVSENFPNSRSRPY